MHDSHGEASMGMSPDNLLAAAMLGGDLAGSLQPAIERACRGKLEDIRWFTTDWQRGGAATAFARVHEAFNSIEGWETERDVLIKAPIGWQEYRTLRDLSMTTAPVPRVCMMGMELEGYDLAWVVMERLAGDPLHLGLNGHPREVYDRVCRAAAAFYVACERAWKRPVAAVIRFDWFDLLAKARAALEDNPGVPRHADWLSMVKRVSRLLETVVPRWRARDITTWCHGDLHPGNVMERAASSPWGPPGCVLIDFAETKPGHWIEDAVYMERLCWARPELLARIDPVGQLAAARREVGLPVDADARELADIRRMLMAASAPAFMHKDGHPAYLAAALGILERVVPGLGG